MFTSKGSSKGFIHCISLNPSGIIFVNITKKKANKNKREERLREYYMRRKGGVFLKEI